MAASDGQEAIELMQTHGGDISLIFCDMRMPNKDGMDVLRWKGASEHRDIPIVMLTTEGSPSAIAEGRSLGAKGWIVKPFNESMLLAAAQNITSQATRKTAAG